MNLISWILGVWPSSGVTPGWVSSLVVGAQCQWRGGSDWGSRPGDGCRVPPQWRGGVGRGETYTYDTVLHLTTHTYTLHTHYTHRHRQTHTHKKTHKYITTPSCKHTWLFTCSTRKQLQEGQGPLEHHNVEYVVMQYIVAQYNFNTLNSTYQYITCAHNTLCVLPMVGILEWGFFLVSHVSLLCETSFFHTVTVLRKWLKLDSRVWQPSLPIQRFFQFPFIIKAVQVLYNIQLAVGGLLC